MLDVPEEQWVWPDYQHALALEGKAIGVQQVCRPVQRDRRLAGTRAALHNKNATERAANDLVLFPLDGGDDVAHTPRSGSGQRREKSRGAREARSEPDHPELLGGVAGGSAVGGVAEQLVFEIENPAALGEEVTPPGEAHRLRAGGTVKGLGHRRPPVDDQRFLVVVGHSKPADVERLGHWNRLAVGGRRRDAGSRARGRDRETRDGLRRHRLAVHRQAVYATEHQ